MINHIVAKDYGMKKSAAVYKLTAVFQNGGDKNAKRK